MKMRMSRASLESGIFGIVQSADNSGLSLFTAIQEQLGLKLLPEKGPVPLLVIDHVERRLEK